MDNEKQKAVNELQTIVKELKNLHTDEIGRAIDFGQRGSKRKGQRCFRQANACMYAINLIELLVEERIKKDG